MKRWKRVLAVVMAAALAGTAVPVNSIVLAQEETTVTEMVAADEQEALPESAQVTSVEEAVQVAQEEALAEEDEAAETAEALDIEDVTVSGIGEETSEEKLPEEEQLLDVLDAKDEVTETATYQAEIEAASASSSYGTQVDSGSCDDTTLILYDSDGDGRGETLVINGSGKYTGITEFWNKYALSVAYVIIEEGVTGIGSWAFLWGNNMTTIKIPSSVRSIEQGAFYMCGYLTTIEFSVGLTNIEANAFNYCSSLTTVELPSGVTSIGVRAFANCSNLSKITIPESVTSIEENAFQDCNASLTIYGKTGSYAETYARNNKITFVSTGTVNCASGHTWGEWKTTTAATVFAAAKQTRTCSVCGKTETRTSGKKLTATLKVTSASLKLKTGESTTSFKAYGFANGDYLKSVTSSKTSIVKVSNVNKKGTFKLTAQKKTGKSVLTIKLASGKSAKVTVTVQKGTTTVKTTKITGVPSKKTLKVKKNFTLSPKLTPSNSTQKITYSSSNKKVATVNSKGKVTAKKAGKAVITVKSGSITVKCTVTVTK